MRSVLLLSFLVACSPYKPGADAGSPEDAAADADASTPCVPDYAACTPASKCCTPGNVCNASTHVCQVNCTPINGLCTDNANCCSGICNGTCQ
jgi:hypothetical protein